MLLNSGLPRRSTIFFKYKSNVHLNLRTEQEKIHLMSLCVALKKRIARHLKILKVSAPIYHYVHVIQCNIYLYDLSMSKH